MKENLVTNINRGTALALCIYESLLTIKGLESLTIRESNNFSPFWLPSMADYFNSGHQIEGMAVSFAYTCLMLMAVRILSKDLSKIGVASAVIENVSILLININILSCVLHNLAVLAQSH